MTAHLRGGLDDTMVQLVPLSERGGTVAAKARVRIDKARHLHLAVKNGRVELEVVWNDGTHWLPVKLKPTTARAVSTWILNHTKEG